MKTFKTFACGALVAMAAVALPRAAAAQDTSVVRDLLTRGKQDLDGLDYSAAAQIATQLLQVPSLTKEQRVGAIELLLAAVYPDDPSSQHADSAVALIGQLVDLGVTSGVAREIATPPLDTLFASVVRRRGSATATVAVQGEPATVARVNVHDNADTLVTMLQKGLTADDVLQRVTIDCYSFPFAALDTGLRRVQGPATLTSRLKRTCTRVVVIADAPNASLSVSKRDMGTVPASGSAFWADPAADATVAVLANGYRVEKVTEFAPGKYVEIRFSLPRDTMPWPVPRTPDQIASELHLFDHFTPSTPKPVAPVRPRYINAGLVGFIWGVLGGGAGYAVAQFVPTMGCVSNFTVPSGETWLVNGQRYSGGQSVNLGKGSSCTMTIAGGSAAGMFLFTSLIATGVHHAGNRRYAAAASAYPGRLNAWETAEHRAVLDRSPELKQALSADGARLAQVRTENQTTVEHNQHVAEPVVTVRDLRPDQDSQPQP